MVTHKTFIVDVTILYISATRTVTRNRKGFGKGGILKINLTA